VDTIIAEWILAATKTTEEMRRIAETKEIAGSMATAAHRAMCTTAQARRRSLSKETETKREAGAEAINGKIRVPAGSAATTVADKRGAMSREVRPAMAEAASAAVAAVVVASAEAAGAVAVAGAGKEQFLRGHNDTKKCDTEKRYAADEDRS
jgi:hypothetical protein